MTKREADETSFDGVVPGSFFLHRAEKTGSHRDDTCSEFFPRHRTVVSDEGMRLFMSPYGGEPLMRGMCQSWHEGC